MLKALRYVCVFYLVAALGGVTDTAVARHKTAGRTSGIPTCQPLKQDLLAGDGIYFGETHGTREMPELFMCFVRRALTQSGKPIVVSLELPDASSPLWSMDWEHPTDGRTSQAMAKLVSDLRKLEQINRRVTIAYQVGCPTDGIPDDPSAFDNRCIADKIRASMAKGFVVAYSGNNHAARVAVPIKTSAAELPTSIKTVEIIFTDDGSAWGTYNGSEPGVSPVQGRNDLSGTSGFIPGKSPGFDYAYVIKTVTASLPANKAP